MSGRSNPTATAERPPAALAACFATPAPHATLNDPQNAIHPRRLKETPMPETRDQLIARTLFAHDLETELTGGCGICDTEHDEKCAACHQCRCHRHDTCTRPAV